MSNVFPDLVFNKNQRSNKFMYVLTIYMKNKDRITITNIELKEKTIFDNWYKSIKTRLFKTPFYINGKNKTFVISKENVSAYDWVPMDS